MSFTFDRCFALILIGLTLTNPTAALPENVPREVVRSAYAATVRITAQSDDSMTVGSGAYIGRKGAFDYILTADHVVDTGHLTIETFHRDSNGTVIPADAEVVVRSPSADIAVIRIPVSGKWPRPLKVSSPDRDPVIDQPAVLVGCADGDAPGWMVFNVLGEAEREHGTRFWLTHEAPRSGQSGGPLVDADGYLIGVCSASWGDQGLFGSTEEIHALLKRAKLTSLMSPGDELPTDDDSPIVARRPTRPPISGRRSRFNPDTEDICPIDDDEFDIADNSSIHITDNGIILIQQSGSRGSVRIEIVDGDVYVNQDE